MPEQSLRTSINAVARQAARWRPRSNRQIWLIVAALVIASGIEAVAIPSRRQAFPCLAIGLLSMGWWAAQSRRQRHRREALAVRLAGLSRDDIPSDVIDLVAAGKKIQAIKRYRELSGTDLKEAKAVIDRL